MKKLLVIFISLFFLTGCSPAPTESENLKVVATLFPQYDFARTIGGDKVDVSLLLKPGTDSHSYEPTGADIIEISNSDIFIYTGKSMEAWAQTILDSVSNSDLNVLDVSDGIEIATVNSSEHEHAHNVYDPHIWTDPQNAKIICKNILDSFIKADPENTDYYTQNAEKLFSELDLLDKDFELFFSEGENKKMIFGGKFALYYFAKRYNVEYEAAYDSCGTQSEPSPGKIAHLIDEIKSKNLKAVFYAELTAPTVAETIAKETGAKPLLFHSCHNVSNEDFKNGETYISLMRKNLENLKQGMK